MAKFFITFSEFSLEIKLYWNENGKKIIKLPHFYQSLL